MLDPELRQRPLVQVSALGGREGVNLVQDGVAVPGLALRVVQQAFSQVARARNFAAR